MKKIPRLITNESVNMKMFICCDDNGNNLMKTISSITKPCYFREDVF